MMLYVVFGEKILKFFFFRSVTIAENKNAQMLHNLRRAHIMSFMVRILTFDLDSLLYTVSQKGCHPNHGYNFVNS